jgi:hypothetical protein
MKIILAALATYRLANLLVEEDGPFRIFAIVRERITGKAVVTKREPWKSLSGLVTCHLCAGIWMAALCAILVTAESQAADAFLLIFGLAGAQAFLAKRDG